MVHKNTELLTDYWHARRPAFGSPPRSSIDPTQFIGLLPQVFILGRKEAGHYDYRLAGSLVSFLHRDRLVGSDFLAPWSTLDRPSLQSSIETAIRRSRPLVFTAQARTGLGRALELELLLAPLAGGSGGIGRLLGLLQPLSPVGAVAGQSIDLLRLRRIGGADDSQAESPRLRLAALDGRLIA